LVVVDIVDFEAAGVRVSHNHVGFAEATEIAETHDLPIQSNRAHEGGVGDLVAGDVVDLEAAGIGIAQQHVAFAAA
jgi:hypothetical protein